MEKQSSFRSPKMEKQQSFRSGVMEKQKSFRGLIEKQKSFRIAMERQISFGGERKRSKDSPGKRGDSPLHLAARAGNLGKVKEIFQKFENINNGIKDLLSNKNQEGETPLYIAAENGHALIVGEFLRHSDVETASIVANNGYDPYHVAAKQGHIGESFILFIFHYVIWTNLNLDDS
ncbi:ankyrin repeat-containing At5g02620-like [Olea europaea subsp. europaea]|uniref:Ankyrin repeat-containing At5g02620-like n=1 Tax=Olea europaea subsp. europaea TaxID=158383 RepID=A0A8S0VIV8_OLEEU|nr:ankyrin repeat-containing At5g02620-like [Olea europaea subsp. europaea]